MRLAAVALAALCLTAAVHGNDLDSLAAQYKDVAAAARAQAEAMVAGELGQQGNTGGSLAITEDQPTWSNPPPAPSDTGNAVVINMQPNRGSDGPQGPPSRPPTSTPTPPVPQNTPSNTPSNTNTGSSSSTTSSSGSSSGSSSTMPIPSDIKTKPAGNKYDYKEALKQALLFYEAQRSGKLPSTNRIKWRGDSLLNDKYGSKSLAGGYFDAGDHLKITYPMAFALSQLAWGMLEFQSEYNVAKEWDEAQSALKWGLDWLLRAHVDDDTLVVMVGDPTTDHKNWGRPEDNTLDRPVYVVDKKKPGSDAFAATAAALAAGSIVFAKDKEYSKELISHAETLFKVATASGAIYSLHSSQIPDAAAQLYKSTRADDDIAWAALWLYEATGKQEYKTWGENEYFKAQRNNWIKVDIPTGSSCSSANACYWTSVRTWNWDNAYPGAMVLLAGGKSANASAAAIDVDRWLQPWIRTDAVVKQTPKGLNCLACDSCTWGANRNSANAALLALIAAKYTNDTDKKEQYRCFAQKQIDYMLGDQGRSLLTGFGKNPPNQPHHRGASCPNKPAPCTWDNFNTKSANPQTLPGALVSGSCSDTFVDSRQDFKTNEVALDKDSGFIGALAALVSSGNRC